MNVSDAVVAILGGRECRTGIWLTAGNRRNPQAVGEPPRVEGLILNYSGELAQRLLHRETRGFGLGFGAAGTSGRARFMLCNAGTRPRAPRFNFVQGLWSCGCLCLESDL